MKQPPTGALLLALLSLPQAAKAEQGEWVIGLDGALVLPSLSAPDSTAFALATWGVGAHAQYGLLDDLFLDVGGLFGVFGARVADTEEVKGRKLEGVRAFDLQQLELELGGRYNLYAGYDVAPFLEAHVGLLWAIFRNQHLLDEAGRDFGIEIADRASASLSLSVGFAVEWRIWNVAFVGASVRWTELFGERLYRGFLSVPLRVAYYW